jgi:hypothetical protein
MSSQRPLTWREVGDLHRGDKIVFTTDFVAHCRGFEDAEAGIPDIIVPAGSTAVVDVNLLHDSANSWSPTTWLLEQS